MGPKVPSGSPASLADDSNSPEGEVRGGAALSSPAAFRTPCAATLSVAPIRLARLVQVHAREAALRVGLPRQGILRACLLLPVRVHAREDITPTRPSLSSSLPSSPDGPPSA